MHMTPDESAVGLIRNKFENHAISFRFHLCGLCDMLWDLYNLLNVRMEVMQIARILNNAIATVKKRSTSF